MHPKPLSFFGVGFLRWFFRVFQRRDDDRLASLVAGYTYQKKHGSEQRQQNLCATFLEHRGLFIGNPKSWLCIILIEVAIVCYCNIRVCNTVSSGI